MSYGTGFGSTWQGWWCGLSSWCLGSQYRGDRLETIIVFGVYAAARLVYDVLGIFNIGFAPSRALTIKLYFGEQGIDLLDT
jgi:hypothetical protein